MQKTRVAPHAMIVYISTAKLNYMYVASSEACMVSALTKPTNCSCALNSKYQILAKLAATIKETTVQAEMKLFKIIHGTLLNRDDFPKVSERSFV